MSESSLVSALADYLLYHHFLVIRLNSGALQPDDSGDSRYVTFNWWQALGLDRHTAGAPDLLAFRVTPDGRGCLALAIEAKTPARRNAVTVEQRAFLEAWRAAGGVGLVVCGVEELERVVEGQVTEWRS